MGIIPGGAYRNLDHVQSCLHVADTVDQALADLCADPQTSGGLAGGGAARTRAEALVERLRVHAPQTAVIGRAEPLGEFHLILE